MSTSTVDLSSLQQIDFGGGQTGFYDSSSGSYFDSGGNPLSAGDLAQYGSFTVSTPGTQPASLGSGGTGAGTVSSSGSGGALSGLSGVFSSIGGAMVNALRPQTVTAGGQTLVYNPKTGGYTTPAALTASAALNPLLLLAVAGAVIWLVMRERA
jgi:hypothetical protein